MNVVSLDFQGSAIAFNAEGWFNATVAASRFGKRPIDWLRLPDTERYLGALCRDAEVGKSHFARTKRGGLDAGTWLHPKLAVAFARWLDLDFAVWCDSQIDKLLRGQGDWKRMRHEAAASHKVMCQILQLAREDDGKETVGYHYANESRLVNRVISGEWGGLDRDSLSLERLDLLAKLEVKNTVMLARKASKEDRVKALEDIAANHGQKALRSAA